VIITPHDAPDWLHANQCFVVSEVTFDQLTGNESFRQFASTLQLIAGLRNPSMDFGPDVRVAIHGRMVQPLLDLTLLFIGLPLVASRESRNVFIAIGQCMGLVAVFLLVVIGFQQLGRAMFLLSPAQAAWAPLMLFVPAAVELARGLRK
jgi:lipopolysaccharide export system permease protein